MNDTYTYHIRLHGQIDENEINIMSPLLLTIEHAEPLATVFQVFTDQSGFIGLLRHLHGSGFVLISTSRVDDTDHLENS